MLLFGMLTLGLIAVGGGVRGVIVCSGGLTVLVVVKPAVTTV